MLRHRIPEAGDAREIGLRRIGGDFERRGVERLDAERRGIGALVGDVRPALDAAGEGPVPVEVVAFLGGALQREDIVLRRERLAIAPDEAVLQLEGPGQAVGGLGPALGAHRIELELAVELGERQRRDLGRAGAVIDRLHVVHVGAARRPARAGHRAVGEGGPRYREARSHERRTEPSLQRVHQIPPCCLDAGCSRPVAQ